MCATCMATENVVHNFVLEASCDLSEHDKQENMLNTTCLYLAAREWSSTHVIRQWKSTSFQLPADVADLESERYRREYGIPSNVLFCHAQYTSYVYLPGILSPIMNVNVELNINKYVYVTQHAESAMYTVTKITGLPLLNECLIYSRNIARFNSRILSRNTAAFPDVPWYLKLFQPHIEQSLRDSLWRNAWALGRAWCGEL